MIFRFHSSALIPRHTTSPLYHKIMLLSREILENLKNFLIKSAAVLFRLRFKILWNFISYMLGIAKQVLPKSKQQDMLRHMQMQRLMFLQHLSTHQEQGFFYHSTGNKLIIPTRYLSSVWTSSESTLLDDGM